MKNRLYAAAIHLLVTLVVFSFIAAAIFLIWYPGPFAKMVGGQQLFLIVACCDLVLGPLISLVIFDIKKPRGKLIFDYAIVAALQLSALVYGVSVIADSRPIFVVFTVDRLEVVTSIELEKNDLVAALLPQYQAKPFSGFILAAIEMPTDVGEHNQLLSSALTGKDVYLMPKYYRPYKTNIHDIKNKSKPLSVLLQRNQDIQIVVNDRLKKLKRSQRQVLWLPVHHRFGFWTALIDADTGYPLDYLPIYPY